jgi:hypothetical protein
MYERAQQRGFGRSRFAEQHGAADVAQRFDDRQLARLKPHRLGIRTGSCGSCRPERRIATSKPPIWGALCQRRFNVAVASAIGIMADCAALGWNALPLFVLLCTRSW